MSSMHLVAYMIVNDDTFMPPQYSLTLVELNGRADLLAFDE